MVWSVFKLGSWSPLILAVSGTALSIQSYVLMKLCIGLVPDRQRLHLARIHFKRKYHLWLNSKPDSVETFTEPDSFETFMEPDFKKNSHCDFWVLEYCHVFCMHATSSLWYEKKLISPHTWWQCFVINILLAKTFLHILVLYGKLWVEIQLSWHKLINIVKIPTFAKLQVIVFTWTLKDVSY